MDWTETYMHLNFHTGPLLVFGLFLLVGVLGGTIANRISWLPTISSFMALGFIIGPHGLSLVTNDMLHESSVLTTIAMGLILYKLGNVLHPLDMLHDKALQWTALAENLLSFILIFALVMAFGFGLAHAWIVAAIAISSSPAVLVHVASEMRAKGPVTDRAKSLIAVNNLASYALFSLAIPFVMGSYGSMSVSSAVIYTIYRVVGAVGIGTLVAWVSVRLAKMLTPHDKHYLFTIMIGAISVVLGLCNMLSLSTLLASLVLGIATRWFETDKHNLSRVAIGEGGDLFFIILFVFAGAKLDIGLVLATGLLPVLLVLARMLGKAGGVYGMSFLLKRDEKQAGPVSLLLMPMASMAIGLVLAFSRLVPEMAAGITATVLSMVAILETVGPIAAKEAFLIAGEADKEDEE